MLTLEQPTFERVLADSPAGTHEGRKAAFASFQEAAMPTGREESWRYVDLDFDLKSLALPSHPGALGPSPFLEDVTDRLATVAIVDGFVTESGTSADPNVTISRLAESGRLAPDLDTDIFANAAGAFGRDGIVITAAPGTAASTPVVVDVSATQPGTVSFPVILIDVGRNAEVPVVIVFRSADGEMVVSPQIGGRVDDGGRLRLTTVQAWGPGTVAAGFQRLVLGRDASIRVGEVGLGGRLGRLDFQCDLDGDGSSSDLVGIYFGDGEQVLDYRVVVNHRGKNTSSEVTLKGAVEDSSESVFTGLHKIWPDATNTSTFETNRNLVLSENAKAHSVPNLEILCDDVVCGHGSTVGPLETDHLYYLQSRGLNKDRAERVLLRGFFEEMIGRLPAPQLAPSIRHAVNEKFIRAQAEGRIA